MADPQPWHLGSYLPARGTPSIQHSFGRSKLSASRDGFICLLNCLLQRENSKAQWLDAAGTREGLISKCGWKNNLDLSHSPRPPKVSISAKLDEWLYFLLLSFYFFFNYYFPNFDLNISVSTRQRFQNFKGQCSFSSSFSLLSLPSHASSSTRGPGGECMAVWRFSHPSFV